MAELGESVVLTPGQEFIAHERRWKFAAGATVCIALAALALHVVVDPEAFLSRRRSSVEVIWSSGVALLLFAVALAAESVRRLFKRPETLTIGRRGIRHTRWSSQTMPWEAISEVRTNSVRGMHSIGIILDDPAKYPGRQPERFIQSLGRRRARGDIDISLYAYDRSFNEAMAAIERFRPPTKAT